MSRDWNERAQKNAFHYIASWQNEWDLKSFLASGEEDITRLVVPTLERCSLVLGGMRMLELGCGVGRMTHSFARRFEQVYAFDISREMLSRARQIHSGETNILWLLSSGANLACVASDSMDFVFSYLVLQHLPEQALALQYIREMVRVLRPGCAFLFQFNGGFVPTMNWRGRLAWGIVDALWSARLDALSRRAAFCVSKFITCKVLVYRASPQMLRTMCTLICTANMATRTTYERHYPEPNFGVRASY